MKYLKRIPLCEMTMPTNFDFIKRNSRQELRNDRETSSNAENHKRSDKPLEDDLITQDVVKRQRQNYRGIRNSDEADVRKEIRINVPLLESFFLQISIKVLPTIKHSFILFREKI